MAGWTTRIAHITAHLELMTLPGSSPKIQHIPAWACSHMERKPPSWKGRGRGLQHWQRCFKTVVISLENISRQGWINYSQRIRDEPIWKKGHWEEASSFFLRCYCQLATVVFTLRENRAIIYIGLMERGFVTWNRTRADREAENNDDLPDRQGRRTGGTHLTAATVRTNHLGTNSTNFYSISTLALRT